MNLRAKLLLGVALAAPCVFAFSPGTAIAQANSSHLPGAQGATSLSEIVVTAERRAEPLQSVPIAVTAFGNAALETRQIRDTTDVQFFTPNVTFTPTNFSGNNLTIRGVGSLLIAGESGVAVHYNDIYIVAPRLTEAEYYDVDDVEVLRGPQGTLFGRSATGGVLDVKTQAPVLGLFSGNLQTEYGNYNDFRVKGAVNIPLVDDKLAVRLAGIYQKRDGTSFNVNTGNDIDGRDLYSYRASVRYQPTAGTSLEFVGSYFNEDDNRMPFQKQLCLRDPSGVLGCLPTGNATQPTNSVSSGAGITSNVFTNLVLGQPGLGLIDFFNPPVSANPTSYREVNQAFDPSYKTRETFLMLKLNQKLTDHLDLQVLAGYQNYGLNESTDFASSAYRGITLPAQFFTYKPAEAAFLGLAPGSAPPVSGQGLCGIACGNTQTSSGSGLQQVATGGGKQESVELKVNSHFDGRLNFLIAASFLHDEYSTGLSVNEPFLDYAAAILAGPDPSKTTFNSLIPSRFQSYAPYERLNSQAVFGEVYYQIVPDRLKLTLGFRYTQDEKESVSRQALFSVPVSTDILTGAVSYTSPSGQVTTSNNEQALLNAAAAACAIDFDPSKPGCQPFANQRLTARAPTGRAVLDYTPSLPFTNQTLIYASYSRGYKAGGFNPPADPLLNLGAPPTYSAETIDAFELGTKNLLLGRSLQLNLTGFYYDYHNLQIGTINNRTSYTTNAPVKIYGEETEIAWKPTRRLELDASGSYLHTEIGNVSSIDPRNPSQNNPDADLIKDPTSNGNCVVLNNGNVPIQNNPALLTALNSNGSFYLPTGPAGVPYLPAGAPAGGIPSTPGFPNSAFASCAGLAANKTLAADGYTFYASGLPASLQGNALPNSPRFSFTLGAQYTWNPIESVKVVARVDYSWRDKFFGTQYNAPRDRISSYGLTNLSVTLSPEEDRWFVRGFVSNLFNKTAIVGLYDSDPGAGLYTNAFLTDPRLFGLQVGAKF